MFLQPKNRKYTKEQKCPVKGHQIKIGQHRLTYGSYGLKYIKCVGRSNSYITPAHCEAVRRVIVRKMKRSLRFYIRIFCYKPITQKPTKTRMGKGKGSVSQWVCPIKPGQILFEINGGVSEDVAKEVLKKASKKLPIVTKIVKLSQI